jgi:stress response protein YsnF
MYGHNLIAVYRSRAAAEQTRERLIAGGFPASDIRLSEPAMPSTGVSDREEPGFWDWLFGNAPEDDREAYGSQIRQNRAVLSVCVPTEHFHQAALKIMEEYEPIELNDQFGTPEKPSAGLRTSGGTTADPTQPRQEGEQVITIVKEELSVGKRATERHYRVRSYVIEKPVEEQVRLRDERVEIERRPVSGAADTATMPQQREIDVVERHEEPVIEKRGRATEEVVVRKEVTERPETVRGTVRETKVDAEKEPATGAGSAASRPNQTNPRR